VRLREKEKKTDKKNWESGIWNIFGHMEYFP
jgi:hypothetical protein